MNLKFKIYNLQSGQSLFELVVAIAISALIIVAIVSLTTNSIQNSNFSKNKALAATYAQQATEWLRGQRDNNIDAFITHAESSPWCLSDISTDLKGWGHLGACADDNLISGTIFKRWVTFPTSEQNGVIAASVTVSWTDSQGVHEVTSATNLADLRQR